MLLQCKAFLFFSFLLLNPWPQRALRASVASASVSSSVFTWFTQFAHSDNLLRVTGDEWMWWVWRFMVHRVHVGLNLTQ